MLVNRGAGCVVWFAPSSAFATRSPSRKVGASALLIAAITRRQWRRVDHRRLDMMTFLATSKEEDLLTQEVSDEALEAAGGNEAVGNYTLAACTGLSVCPG